MNFSDLFWLIYFGCDFENHKSLLKIIFWNN
jgi:hypothetical protein